MGGAFLCNVCLRCCRSTRCVRQGSESRRCDTAELQGVKQRSWDEGIRTRLRSLAASDDGQLQSTCRERSALARLQPCFTPTNGQRGVGSRQKKGPFWSGIDDAPKRATQGSADSAPQTRFLALVVAASWRRSSSSYRVTLRPSVGQQRYVVFLLQHLAQIGRAHV